VQQVTGGNPVQITNSPGQNWHAACSPDGNIAYRSEQETRNLFHSGARRSRAGTKNCSFWLLSSASLDGSEVLFRTHFTAIGYSNRFYLVRLDRGPPREVLAGWIAQNKFWATSAAWHPDGKKITVWVGTSTPSPAFWTLPVEGGSGIELKIPPAIQREPAEAAGGNDVGRQFGEYRFCWSRLGNALYFVRGYKGARNVWKLTVDPETLRATGIDRLTTGPGPDAAVAVSADAKRLAFTAMSQRIQSWLFPFNATTGQITGEGNAITSPVRISLNPQVSPDEHEGRL
jgi:Tol biopolymer transport system component